MAFSDRKTCFSR